jgi:glycolate oxidase FAD binding subunit
VPEEGDAQAAVLRGYLAKAGGHATLVRASKAVQAVVPVFHPEPAGVAALSAGLRAKFDPRGVFNPGLMG